MDLFERKRLYEYYKEKLKDKEERINMANDCITIINKLGSVYSLSIIKELLTHQDCRKILLESIEEIFRIYCKQTGDYFEMFIKELIKYDEFISFIVDNLEMCYLKMYNYRDELFCFAMKSKEGKIKIDGIINRFEIAMKQGNRVL